MPVYFCSSCRHVEEMTEARIDEQIDCSRCGHPNRVAVTAEFINRLVKMYLLEHRALKSARAQLAGRGHADSDADSSNSDWLLGGVDLSNTAALSTDAQHRPIGEWFELRGIRARFKYRAIDTTEYYDEAAVAIGRGFDRCQFVIGEIRAAQSRGLSQVNIPLVQLAPDDAKAATALCDLLHEYHLLADCRFKPSDRCMRLTLQTTPSIVDFFGGAWLEWFALMEVLSLCQEQRIGFSCARDVSVVFPDETDVELDVFWLIDGAFPVWIQCVTGDCVNWLPVYELLSGTLGFGKEQFVLCVSGLPGPRASALTTAHGITVVNEVGLRPHLARLIKHRADQRRSDEGQP